ncbi:unnamed protein product, partial [marine sediment metagenome]
MEPLWSYAILAVLGLAACGNALASARSAPKMLEKSWKRAEREIAEALATYRTQLDALSNSEASRVVSME